MKKVKNLLRNLNYLTKHSLWDQREEDIVYLTNKILDDATYEFDLVDQGSVKPHILDGDKSFELIISSGKSFVRTGDGEIKIMMGMDQPFQKYDSKLAIGLRDIFLKQNENLLVGINRNYYIPGYLRNYSPFYRRYAYDFRQYYKTIINEETTYIDATLTSFQFGFQKDPRSIERYQKWKDAFKNKKLLIVCGEGILDKLEYDVFEMAETKNYIYGPSKHAWTEHEKLISQIKENVTKDTLVIFILGMAGKVMISQLSQEGITCWDVGHLAKYYDAYMKGVDSTPEYISSFYAPD